MLLGIHSNGCCSDSVQRLRWDGSGSARWTRSTLAKACHPSLSRRMFHPQIWINAAAITPENHRAKPTVHIATLGFHPYRQKTSPLLFAMPKRAQPSTLTRRCPLCAVSSIPSRHCSRPVATCTASELLPSATIRPPNSNRSIVPSTSTETTRSAGGAHLPPDR